MMMPSNNALLVPFKIYPDEGCSKRTLVKSPVTFSLDPPGGEWNRSPEQFEQLRKCEKLVYSFLFQNWSLGGARTVVKRQPDP